MCGCWLRKAASAFGRYSDKARGVGEQADGGLHAAGKGGEIAAHRLHIVEHDPRMIEQAFAGRGEFDAAAAALEQRDAERGFQALDPLAGGGQRQMDAERAVGDAARLGHRDEELEIDQIETHRHGSSPSACLRPEPKACSVTPDCAGNADRSMCRHDQDPFLLLIRRRLPARRVHQGRDRAWAADGVDGPARGDDAAGTGAGHRHRAGHRHQYLADLCRPLSARHHRGGCGR